MIPEPQRTYLLELFSALGPAAEGLVLVGGHALRFMITHPRATRDFDFVLDVAYLRDCSTSLESVLGSLGYAVDENARNFQFEKPIPNSPKMMRIEFMAPAEFARKDGTRVDVQSGIHGRACVGGSIVVMEADGHEVVGSLPDGKPARALHCDTGNFLFFRQTFCASGRGTPRGCPCGGRAQGLPLQNVFGCGQRLRCATTPPLSVATRHPRSQRQGHRLEESKLA